MEHQSILYCKRTLPTLSFRSSREDLTENKALRSSLLFCYRVMGGAFLFVLKEQINLATGSV